MHYFRLALAAAYGASLGNSITILPGGDPKPYGGAAGVITAEDFFRQSAPNEFVNSSAQILMSAFDDIGNGGSSGTTQVLPSAASFVRGAIQAWGEHLHLVIRAEEVWFTILAQMNFFINTHTEDVRNIFTAYNDREIMYLEDTEWFRVIQDFKTEVTRRVKADWLLDWMFPRFTTTNPNDGMVATILMMGLTKAHYDSEGGIICGLPSVTLLGEKTDWQNLLAKLDRLPDFGSEPRAYGERLKPILSRFVASFENPDSESTRAFWNQIVLASPTQACGGPPYHMSGWLTGFFFWDDEGKPFAREPGKLTLDNQTYPTLNINQLPVGYARAPFLIRDYDGTPQFEAYVMAGTLGKQISPGSPEGYSDALKRVNAPDGLNSSHHGTIQPVSAWVLYGPSPHNTTVPKWLREEELVNLSASLKTDFNDTHCESRPRSRTNHR